MQIQFKIYRIFLFLLFIISMYPWFMWGDGRQYISIIGGVYTIFLLMQGRIMNLGKKKFSSAFAFLLLYLWMAKYYNMFGYIESIANWIILVGIIALKNFYRAPLIQLITKCFAWLLLVSLVFYILHFIGLPLSSSTINRGMYLKPMTNYYAFVIIEGSYRFQSIFLEPGHMTMGLAPLLFLNGYDYKNKKVLIMLIAQLFSFSLAGYITLIIGYLYTILFSNSAQKFKRIVIILVVFAAFLYSTVSIFGDNLFNDLIISRLEFKDGILVGDNRSSGYLDFEVEQILKSDKIFAGQMWNAELSEKGVAGFKLYFVMYGLIGLVLFLFAYLKTFFLFNNRKMVDYGFLIIILLLLYQNAYPTWWCILIMLTTFSAALGTKKELL